MNNNNLFAGLIIAHYGETIKLEDTSLPSIIIKCNLRRNLPAIAVGDIVNYEIVDKNTNIGVVTKLLPRTTVIYKNIDHSPNYQQKAILSGPRLKPIAANIDQLIIVSAVEPEPQSFLIDQFLVLAELNNISPVIMFNKLDLLENQTNNNTITNLSRMYSDIGYTVLKISSFNSKDIKNLYNILENKNSIFVGASGVGKSSLTKQLVPDLDLKTKIKTANISDKTKLGKHTTTSAKLYHLDQNNTNLIDAPGIREININKIDQRILEQAYIEFKPYAGQCKFRDCKHEKEPNCALKEALQENKISKQRWDNFKKLQNNV